MPTTITVPGSGGGRPVLTADRDYYVATAAGGGNNSNSGLVGFPFLTIQKAIDVASALDLNNHYVTIHVADGTYPEVLNLRSLVGAPPYVTAGGPPKNAVYLIGNVTTPSAVTIGLAAPSSPPAITADSSGYFISGFRCVFSDVCITLFGGVLLVMGRMELDTGASGFHFGVLAAFGAQLIKNNQWDLYGTGWGAFVYNIGGYVSSGNNIVVHDNPAWGYAFIVCETVGIFSTGPTAISGAATGMRFSASTNSVISTTGAALTYFPGDAAGTLTSGAQYT